MIQRTYNNTLKYKHICEELQEKINKDKYIEFKNKYSDIGLFCEEILGIKLTTFHKLMLNMVYYKNYRYVKENYLK